MPNPNDPAQQQQLDQQIQQKQQERDAAAARGEDTSQLDGELASLQTQKQQAGAQQTQAHDQNRDTPQDQGRGGDREDTPGQQNKK